VAADDPAVGFHFKVEVGLEDFGAFTACEGLGAEYEVFEYQEGGQNTYVHRIPGRLKYTPIKLTRPLDHDSQNGSSLATWFAKLKNSPSREQIQKTATITAMDARGGTVAVWHLEGVYPARWTGPSLTADGNAVLKETIELAHNGFVS
jgi:phage tail-like protein